jgi:hypothetical protein
MPAEKHTPNRRDQYSTLNVVQQAKIIRHCPPSHVRDMIDLYREIAGLPALTTSTGKGGNHLKPAS